MSQSPLRVAHSKRRGSPIHCQRLPWHRNLSLVSIPNLEPEPLYGNPERCVLVTYHQLPAFVFAYGLVDGVSPSLQFPRGQEFIYHHKTLGLTGLNLGLRNFRMAGFS